MFEQYFKLFKALSLDKVLMPGFSYSTTKASILNKNLISFVYLYVGHSGAQSVPHPGHQVLSLLLCQTLRGYREEERKESELLPKQLDGSYDNIQLGLEIWGRAHTRLSVLELLLFVVIHDDVRLHRDQLLLVKLPQVEQCQLIKLLVAEQHLHPQPESEISTQTLSFSVTGPTCHLISHGQLNTV